MKKCFEFGLNLTIVLFAVLLSQLLLILPVQGEESNNTTYSVTYDGNGYTGGEVPVDNTAYAPGAEVVVQFPTIFLEKTVTNPDGSITTYTCSGWNTAADGSGTPYVTEAVFKIGENTTLYAQWVESFITADGLVYSRDSSQVTIIGYRGIGGVIVIPSQLDSLPVTTIGMDAFRDNEEITGVVIPNSIISIKSRAFIGCSEISTLTIPDSVTTIENSAFAYTGLTQIALPNSITKLENIASLEVADGQASSGLPNGSQLTAPTGKKFDSWNTEADGSGTRYTAGETIANVTGDMTLYAQYVDDTPQVTHTISFDANGGTGSISSIEVADGQASSGLPNGSQLTAPTGKKFDSWNTEADGSGTRYTAGETIANVTGDMTLYAQYVDDTPQVTHTISFDANGGTGSISSIEVADGQASSGLPNGSQLTAPTGKKFDSWNTKSDGSGTRYTAGVTIANVTGDMTLYAQYVTDCLIKTFWKLQI